MSATTYNGKAYRFVGSITLSKLRSINEALTDAAINQKDDPLLMQLLRHLGSIENGRPADMPSPCFSPFAWRLLASNTQSLALIGATKKMRKIARNRQKSLVLVCFYEIFLLFLRKI